MDESTNPYEPPERLVEPESVREETPLGIPRWLWGVWLTGLICILGILPVEEFVIHHRNENFRLGWPGLIPLCLVLTIPWLAEANIQTRVIYFLCAVGAVIGAFLAGAFIAFLIFGLAGVQ